MRRVNGNSLRAAPEQQARAGINMHQKMQESVQPVKGRAGFKIHATSACPWPLATPQLRLILFGDFVVRTGTQRPVRRQFDAVCDEVNGAIHQQRVHAAGVVAARSDRRIGIAKVWALKTVFSVPTRGRGT